ncbi:MAG: hypothetical protein QF444_05340, partial [Phycisphaerales bacterium]|nr:hypothetical protein [Phycisphaerales bacterium]
MYHKFSTNLTVALQVTRRAHLFIAIMLMIAFGLNGAHAQQLEIEAEIDSPLLVTETPSVLFDKGMVEMSVDETLLEEMSLMAGEIFVKDFPINDTETVDLVVEQFFPYKGDIHEAYYAVDSSGNRVVRKRPLEITVKCFRGHVAGFPESSVVFGMSKDMCNGFVQYGETKHTISTDPATQVIAVNDPLAEQPGLKLVREMMRKAKIQQGEDHGSYRDHDGNPDPPPGCGQVTISVVYGADFLALFGGSGGQGAAANYIVTLIGQVSEIFHRDGVIWVEYAIQQITDGSGIVDSAGDLATELCNFVETAVGGLYPDPTSTGSGISDGILILRTTATGSTLSVPGADLTKQSLSYFSGLTVGINPAAANPPPGPPGTTCPAGSNLNAVGSASGMLGATDTTGYDAYIVSQALGTLSGASPTGATASITALTFNALAGGALPSGAGTNLNYDNCDAGAPALGTIMSSCILPFGSTMADNIDIRINTANAIAMN